MRKKGENKTMISKQFMCDRIEMHEKSLNAMRLKREKNRFGIIGLESILAEVQLILLLNMGEKDVKSKDLQSGPGNG